MLPPKPVPEFKVGDVVRVIAACRVRGEIFEINEPLTLRQRVWLGVSTFHWGYGLKGTNFCPSQRSIRLVKPAVFPEML